MLNDVTLFSGLPANDLDTIERHAVRKMYRRNTVLIERGDIGNSLYVVVSGTVKVYVSDALGKEIILNELSDGAYFGELALLGDVPRSASVATETDTTLLILTKPAFQQCLADYPAIAWNLIGALVERTRCLTDAVGDLALLDVYGRLTKLLNASAVSEDGRAVTPPYTHQDMADRVASSREMVTKILKDLKRGGYVSNQGKRLVIERRLPTHW